jgi:hypothetical protein
MNDVDRQIRDRVESFVAELTDLVRQAALESVSEVLGGQAVPGALRRRGGRPPRPRIRRRGGKRSPEEIDATTQRVLDYVRDNPGHGVEQMAIDLATNTKDLTLPIKKLLSNGDLLTEGQKRATKYFATSGGGSASAEGSSAGTPRRRRAAKGRPRGKAKAKAAPKKRGRKRRSKRG